MKILRNRKAVHPVTVSIILIAVTVAVTIAVAAWMGALSFDYYIVGKSYHYYVDIPERFNATFARYSFYGYQPTSFVALPYTINYSTSVSTIQSNLVVDYYVQVGNGTFLQVGTAMYYINMTGK